MRRDSQLAGRTQRAMKFTAIRNATHILFNLLLVLSCAQTVAAQAAAQDTAGAVTGTGTIKGTITDVSGAVVTGAEIKATNEASGQVLATSSSATGEFVFRNLPAGSYSIEVTAPGFQMFRSTKIVVTAGASHELPVRLTVESNRKVVIVQGGTADNYEPESLAIGNLFDIPIQRTPISALVVSRSLLDDQQARLLADVTRNDASVGEDYAPVGWYQDFEIRGFPIDLASGLKINGLTIAGEQLVPLENKESVEILKGVDGLESGVASGGGLINYVTKRPANVGTVNFATDQRGTAYGGLDIGTLFGAQKQFGVRVNLAGEEIRSYVHGADGSRAMGAFAGDWKINKDTFLKGDFEYQHLVQRSVGGYQLLGGTTVPTDVSPDVMLGYQPWAKPNTFDDFNTSVRLDRNLSTYWHFFIAAGRSHTLLDDNIAWPYGCYYVPACNQPGAVPYFFSPTGDYDVYDYRSPGEVRINDQLQAILQGRVKTGPITNDVAIGTSLQRRSVNLGLTDPAVPADTGVVYDYVGTENIYQPQQIFQPSPLTPGPVLLAQDTHQYALVVADHIHLPARINLTVGGQYDTLHDHNFSNLNADGTALILLETNKSIWLPQYSASWRPIDDVLIYGNYSVALSLGQQAPFWATNSSAFLAPYFTRQVEVGAKYQPGHNILLTAALYRMRAPFFYPKPDDEGNVTFVSEGHETHRGLELSAQGKVINWLRLTGTATFLQAISSGTETPAYNDKQVINVPRFRTSWFADLDVPHITGLHFLPGWSYTGPKGATRDDSVSVPGYNLVNLGVRYTPEGEWSRVTFRLFAENVLNKRYWKDTGASFGDTFLHLGAPTTVRLSMQYNF
jgi:iron complex outermembrane receptor protein